MAGRKPDSNSLVAWLVIASFCGVWIFVGSRTLNEALHHDFINFYTGGWLVLHGQAGSLYDPVVQETAERALLPTLPVYVPYIRPPFYALLVAPLAALPVRSAFAVWIGVNAAVLLACWFWGYRRFGLPALVLASMFIPGPMGIAYGQDCVLPLGLVAASYLFAERGRPWTAGALLGALVGKFHLVLLWPVALALERRWKMLGGFACAAAAAAGISLGMVGVSGARAYVDLLRSDAYQELSPSPELMIGVHGLAANLGVSSLALETAAIAVILLLWFATVRRSPLARLYTVTPLASLMIPAHVYGYDAAMLLPGIWLTVAGGSRWPRFAAAALATPFPFCFAMAGRPWAAVGSLSLLLFLAALSWPHLRRQGQSGTAAAQARAQ
jgi:hypothetical protein